MMKDLDLILAREQGNLEAIYLYDCGNQWCAYEQSAYHFLQLFRMGEVVPADGHICLFISNQFEFLELKAMEKVEIAVLDNAEVKFNCLATFVGFEEWKQKLLN